MFKLEAFQFVTNDGSIISDKTKLINAFTGEIFLADKDEVRHKYLVSTEVKTNQIPVAIFTYSDFEYKMRTLIVDHNCVNLINSSIWKYPISRFFVHDFIEKFDKFIFMGIGGCDVLSYEDWIEIFTSPDISEKYKQNMFSAKMSFMTCNRLAPKVWNYLYSNNIYIGNKNNQVLVEHQKWLEAYSQNHHFNCNDLVTNYFNKGLHIKSLGIWHLLSRNAAIGKEFFIDYRHEIYNTDCDIPVDTATYWNTMIDSPNIDSDAFVKYMNVATVPEEYMWDSALQFLDLSNERVVAYIEDNPSRLTLNHSDNPTMTAKWMKHIVTILLSTELTIYDIHTAADSRLCSNSCLLQEDLVRIIECFSKSNKFDNSLYVQLIDNPNTSDQLIEDKIFKRFSEFNDLARYNLYDHSRTSAYFIEKYVLDHLFSNDGLSKLSDNPNLRESHIQAVVNISKKLPKYSTGLSVIQNFGWTNVIANPNISMEFLVKTAQHMCYDRENRAAYVVL